MFESVFKKPKEKPTPKKNPYQDQLAAIFAELDRETLIRNKSSVAHQSEIGKLGSDTLTVISQVDQSSSGSSFKKGYNMRREVAKASSNNYEIFNPNEKKFESSRFKPEQAKKAQLNAGSAV